jgi:hypothetical protein
MLISILQRERVLNDYFHQNNVVYVLYFLIFPQHIILYKQKKVIFFAIAHKSHYIDDARGVGRRKKNE